MVDGHSGNGDIGDDQGDASAGVVVLQFTGQAGDLPGHRVETSTLQQTRGPDFSAGRMPA